MKNILKTYLYFSSFNHKYLKVIETDSNVHFTKNSNHSNDRKKIGSSSSRRLRIPLHFILKENFNSKYYNTI